MQKLVAYLQLCRAANVFTALADIFLGYLLTHAQPAEASRSDVSLLLSPDFALLLVASAGLYLAGMIFNDVFDRDVDARERPGRPIPSGRVSVQKAIRLGTALLVIGCGAAAAVGVSSLLVAGLLVAVIFAYDGWLKETPVGPVAMGACRFLNVLLGASTVAGAGDLGSSIAAVFALPQLHVALGLGTYIAGVTWFSRQEAGESSRLQLAAALGVVDLGLALLIAFVLNSPAGVPMRDVQSALILGLIGFTINRRMVNAILTPTPQNVQMSIKIAILSLIMLNATLIHFVQPNPIYAILVVVLLAPALLLARFLAVT